jgi:hypothetical protein
LGFAGAVDGEFVESVSGKDVGVRLALAGRVNTVDTAVGDGDVGGAAALQGRVGVVCEMVEEGLDELAGGMDRGSERGGES